ncbi:uncharacterized protein LOC101900127 [Musca domestica]|uniref:Uncharacterized protein LOC101900127 n=1 Tax=Musca domestica TaxID=7370 RepID=A0A1I8NC42_MUSDO|nr:uncharacterized protein LOC101900127 [Musca domestica]
MFYSKVIIFLSAFNLLCLSFSSALEDPCDQCIGDSIADKANIISNKRECWFNAKHHYMVKFKDLMMNTLDEEFETLVNGANAEASETCKQEIAIDDCENIEDMDEQAKCFIKNCKTMAGIYREIEVCEKKILMPQQAKLIERFLTGIIGGWRQIHTTC